jgi:DnaJ-class molecular chaperone
MSWRRFATDERWARQVLGFGPESDPDPAEVVRRFRSLLRESHPDHGAESEGAGQRILELTEARRILLP